jgi:hypothetical protein
MDESYFRRAAKGKQGRGGLDITVVDGEAEDLSKE